MVKINEMSVNSLMTIEISKELREIDDNLELIYTTSDIDYMLQCLAFYDDESMTSIRPLNVFKYDFLGILTPLENVVSVPL